MIKKCVFCGGNEYVLKKTDYLYSYKGNYLLVPDTPVEICSTCGMVFYEAAVLKKIEKHFFAIQKREEQPDSYIQLPQMAFGGV